MRVACGQPGPNPPPCALCGSQYFTLLGVLGARTHYRCRRCGIDSSVAAYSTPEKEYHARNPNGHWFDGHEAQFLRSQTHEFLWDGDDLLFISSERMPGAPPRYAVRMMNAVGHITGVPGEFTTRCQAVAAMKRRAKTGIDSSVSAQSMKGDE